MSDTPHRVFIEVEGEEEDGVPSVDRCAFTTARREAFEWAAKEEEANDGSWSGDNDQWHTEQAPPAKEAAWERPQPPPPEEEPVYFESPPPPVEQEPAYYETPPPPPPRAFSSPEVFYHQQAPPPPAAEPLQHGNHYYQEQPAPAHIHHPQLWDGFHRNSHMGDPWYPQQVEFHPLPVHQGPAPQPYVPD